MHIKRFTVFNIQRLRTPAAFQLAAKLAPVKIKQTKRTLRVTLAVSSLTWLERLLLQLGTNARVIQTGRNTMGTQNLPVIVLENVTHRPLQHAQSTASEARSMFPNIE